ncbi:hypothetical protein [Pseudolysinimonas sp.]|uniref:hypothetical protein n=1 Tax=Pseudolysinimonas sp. TaxID=2680009 RepID=UPI003267667C
MSPPDPTAAPLEVEHIVPRNPWIGLGFGILLLISSVLGVVVLILRWDDVLTGDISGRAYGFVVLSPLTFALWGGFVFVRGFLGMRAWNEYHARTTPEQRRADFINRHDVKLWQFVTFGILALAGQIALFVFAHPWHGVASAAGFVQIQLLLFVVWAACLGITVQVLRARQLFAAAHPR